MFLYGAFYTAILHSNARRSMLCASHLHTAMVRHTVEYYMYERSEEIYGAGYSVRVYTRAFLYSLALYLYISVSLSLAHSHLPFACAVLCAETAQNDGWPFCTHGVSFRCAVGTLGMFHLGFVLSTFSYNRPIHSAPCTIHVHFSFRLGYTV